MAYYVCNDCHEVFHEDDAWRVTVKEVEDGSKRVEVYERCPNCGSEDFEIASRCIECGEYLDPSKLRGGYYCNACLTKLSTMETIRDYLAEFIDEYAEYIHERQTGKK